jgi:hypothetical protein
MHLFLSAATRSGLRSLHAPGFRCLEWLHRHSLGTGVGFRATRSCSVAWCVGRQRAQSGPPITHQTAPSSRAVKPAVSPRPPTLPGPVIPSHGTSTNLRRASAGRRWTDHRRTGSWHRWAALLHRCPGRHVDLMPIHQRAARAAGLGFA